MTILVHFVSNVTRARDDSRQRFAERTNSNKNNNKNKMLLLLLLLLSLLLLLMIIISTLNILRTTREGCVLLLKQACSQAPHILSTTFRVLERVRVDESLAHGMDGAGRVTLPLVAALKWVGHVVDCCLHLDERQ